MSRDYEKIMRLFHPVSLSQVCKTWTVNLVLFCLSVLLNAALGLVLGSLIGWMFGRSISKGLELLGLRILISEIHTLGALVGVITGFLAPFYRFPLLMKIRED